MLLIQFFITLFLLMFIWLGLFALELHIEGEENE